MQELQHDNNMNMVPMQNIQPQRYNTQQEVKTTPNQEITQREKGKG